MPYRTQAHKRLDEQSIASEAQNDSVYADEAFYALKKIMTYLDEREDTFGRLNFVEDIRGIVLGEMGGW